MGAARWQIELSAAIRTEPSDSAKADRHFRAALLFAEDSHGADSVEIASILVEFESFLEKQHRAREANLVHNRICHIVRKLWIQNLV